MKIVGITIGCPAGIGPEIILRHFGSAQITPEYRTIVLGDIGVLEKCRKELLSIRQSKKENGHGQSTTVGVIPRIVAWTTDSEIPADAIPVLELSRLKADELRWGHPEHDGNIAMAAYITKGIDLALSGTIDALVTCPISKSGLQDSGYPFPGHTELLAHHTGTASGDFAMMLAGPQLRVTLVTIHCALREVAQRLSVTKVSQLIRRTHQSLKCDFGINNPRIAVAGLNPHGGEDCLFGDEEPTIIEPAIKECLQDGLEIFGPFPPDTVFFKAASGAFNAVVCMYHDQGLIPFKLLHFHDGVNVTLGLPIVRTSVDHGTAYDIAGKGIADHRSLSAAVEMAASICTNRARCI